MRLSYLLCALLAFTSIFSQEKTYQAVNLNPLLTKDANAVVRLDEMKIEVLSNHSMVYEVKQVVTVLNKMGNSYSNTQLNYDKEKKIKSIEAFIYDKNGKEIKRIKRKDFQDLSAADGFSLYRDDRLLYYNYIPIQYPYTLVFNYEVETSDTGFFPPWYFIYGYGVSVEKSYYGVNYSNASLAPDIKEYNLAGFDFKKTNAPGKIVYEAENIPAFKHEQLSPNFADIAPRLKVRLKNFSLKGIEANVTDWNDLGAWIDGHLLKGRDELSMETKRIVQDLVKGVDDTLERAKIIYNYVQENTRYISVQIGIGGWQPISAIEVDKVKYGDCKGLSNYTKALLNEVGVEAYYTVVHAGNGKFDFDKDFPVLQGNHVILAIPYQDDYYWIDCTSQVQPFGFIGDFTDDRNVLVVKPGGGEIVKTIAYLNEENKQSTTASYSLSSQGAINAKVKIETKGVQYDRRFYLEDETNEDVVKYYKKYWSTINNLNIDSFEFTNDKEGISFQENVVLNAKSYGTLSQERMIFVLNAFNRSDYIPKRYRVRKRPFEISRGYEDTDVYDVKIPKGYKVEAMPEATTIASEFGSYSMSVKVIDGETLQYRRTFSLKSGLYAPNKYNDYREFRKNIAKLEKSRVALVKNIRKD